ncbi:unnamed protein product [Microthlaspi erraticum]|uniref:F-box domain-containing protein n=1 Tax=Microthlaspi erraticum TaxID=1685480 RepID=A0A6D2KF47_9BRAS|nr:unnamed protein product [Microthlaspi erraticum]
MDLPEACWELICKLIEKDDYRFLESVSLVSTSFLSITNRVRSTFTITDRTVPLLHRHLRRFRNLKRVSFHHFTKNPVSTLLQVSRSGLDLESLDVWGMPYFPDSEKSGMKMMSNLKEFNVGAIKELREIDLVSIGLCFPSLEKLHIGYIDFLPGPVLDSAIISLSQNLPGLLKIDVTGNTLMTDKSLISLSRNCVLLREVILRDCDLISSDGIEFLLRNSKKLESLAVSGIGWPPKESFSTDAFVYARCLSELDLSGSSISVEFLRSIADAKLPLKKLLLSYCEGIDFDGLLYLVSKYQTLVELSLKGSSFLTDEMVTKLVVFLRCLTSVNLSWCSKLTGVTFFNIVETCVSIKRVKMRVTSFGVEETSKEVDINIKSGLKSLYISGHQSLGDECIEKISRHCPFLETLDFGGCNAITRDGMLQVLRNCGNLTSLNIEECIDIKCIGVVDFELPKLETLRTCGNWINEQEPYTIRKMCGGLLTLDLRGSFNVRSRGVKEIVRRCTRLRAIFLDKCEADDEVFTWLVCEIPSLKKIVGPSGFSPSLELKNLALRHGCVIY